MSALWLLSTVQRAADGVSRAPPSSMASRGLHMARRRVPRTAGAFGGDGGVQGTQPCTRARPYLWRAAARFIPTVIPKDGVDPAKASTHATGINNVSPSPAKASTHGGRHQRRPP